MKKLLQLLTLTALLTQTLSAGEIHGAVQDGNLNEVTRLIAKDPSCVNAEDVDSFTPLYEAIYRNHIAIAKLLLNNGANVNTKFGQIAYTPLHLAAMTDNIDIVELLIAKGADVNMQDALGITPLQLAIENGHTEIAELLREKITSLNELPQKGIS